MSGWRSLLYGAARPLLFRFEPERIHRLTVDALRIAGENPGGRALLALAGGAPRRPRPWVPLVGLRFRNRIGVGAGFDKDGVALRGWAALGLGFAEVGTVTAEPQAGNPRPRLFRLADDAALINRMGFNNAGAAALARRVMLARRHLPADFMVGVNLGRGRTTPLERTVDDYLAAHRLVAPVADYLVVNVSSPNTPGLRDLQTPDAVRQLVAALVAAGDRLRNPRPLLVKLSPDLDDAAFAAVLEAAAGAGAAGFVLSNTTVARPVLRSRHAGEAGGLSGAPLRQAMLARVALARRLGGPDLVLVASGGISSGQDVAAAYEAGADLVQLWTGLVYRGPGLIGEAVAVPYLPPAPSGPRREAAATMVGV
ncbi:MAG TPA: quinone-dependent dihydroorotate dehydrogenase [candidate division Zixibacteria bacterium]|nr:quinone-dependent dihydroorotate dehydrogenase [candidate division Zixibacteria bacterium]